MLVVGDRSRMPKVKETPLMKEHAELLESIAELQRRYPEWRLGQLITNVAGWVDQDIWDVEDEQLLEAARSHLDQRRSGEVEVSCRTNRCN